MFEGSLMITGVGLYILWSCLFGWWLASLDYQRPRVVKISIVATVGWIGLNVFVLAVVALAA